MAVEILAANELSRKRGHRCPFTHLSAESQQLGHDALGRRADAVEPETGKGRGTARQRDRGLGYRLSSSRRTESERWTPLHNATSGSPDIRRREYLTLRAQGLRSKEIRRLVLTESSISATLGSAIGMLAGVGIASQFVLVLRPIFTLPPPLQTPVYELSILAALVLCTTALSSAAAAVIIGRRKPTELLRDE